MAFIDAYLQFGLAFAVLLLAGGTALSLWQHPHWAVRSWDFPRAQIATMLMLFTLAYALFFHQGRWFDWLVLAAGAVALAWQAYRIYPYTRLAPQRILRASDASSPSRLRVLSTNVQMENRDFDRWLATIRHADPDVILVLEPDDWWVRQMQALRPDYEPVMEQPQDNCYGMACYSRRPFSQVAVLYRIQEDIPSLRCEFALDNRESVVFHGVHPRPPEPIRDVSAAPRDAEAIAIAREVADRKSRDDPPTIVTGDFNDVAWSYTSELFMRISGLLDPRIGRGLFSTFPAHLPYLRFPLDHCFHSDHFKLADIRRLDPVGSDHLPLFIELVRERGAPAAQPEFEADASHREDARDRLSNPADG